ncbi:DUF1315 family protein [Aestuariibacter halophilus]|uniref:DUF1315 family protein n=1 Tax=Fluctibacter halophilus TaxID=226011 RepID=A0ABS8G4H9_9ALTE|nr:DUF1315 family protein [Aestuariibacter halophilus]MCC2615433.1 DUF1315 family protein [Aestuariibacter halophilus]
MNIDALVSHITPETYQRLLSAVETGKWADGTPLTDDQKASTLQTVMLYQAKVLKSREHMSVGESGDIVHKSKQQLKAQFSDNEDIARFGHDDL